MVPVALAASAAFMTPVSSLMNASAVDAGGCGFSDLVRIGAPFAVVALVVAVFLIPILLSFQDRKARKTPMLPRRSASQLLPVDMETAFIFNSGSGETRRKSLEHRLGNAKSNNKRSIRQELIDMRAIPHMVSPRIRIVPS